MKIKFIVWLALALVLSACSGQTAIQATIESQKPGAAIRVTGTAPSPATAAEATLEPTDAPAPGGAVTYKIVPGESKVSYEVAETFINQNNRLNVAVGVTSTVSGEIHADLANPPASTIGEISIDISQFTSDSGRRDNAIRNDWLESARYPMAVFKPTAIEGMPESYVEGQEYSFRVTGDLTVKETTRPVTFDVTASLQGDTLSGKATTTIKMSDFNVGPISILGVLNTEDDAKLTLDFVARP